MGRIRPPSTSAGVLGGLGSNTGDVSVVTPNGNLVLSSSSHSSSSSIMSPQVNSPRPLSSSPAFQNSMVFGFGPYNTNPHFLGCRGLPCVKMPKGIPARRTWPSSDLIDQELAHLRGRAEKRPRNPRPIELVAPRTSPTSPTSPESAVEPVHCSYIGRCQQVGRPNAEGRPGKPVSGSKQALCAFSRRHSVHFESSILFGV